LSVWKWKKDITGAGVKHVTSREYRVMPELYGPTTAPRRATMYPTITPL
jgi:hypothetical protein